MENFTYTLNDISKNFNSRDYLKGLNYYKQKKVLSYQIEETYEDSMTITAEVKGTRNYQQSLTFANTSKLLIEGECSCPVGYDCKHVVAVAFALLFDENFPLKNEGLYLLDNVELPKKNDVITEWMSGFEAIHKKQQTSTLSKKDERLIFQILTDENQDFSFLKSKRLKSGLFSKGMRLSTEQLFYSYDQTWKYNYLTEEDKALISELQPLHNEDNSTGFYAEYGGIMLKKLLQSTKCFLASSQTPLKLSEEKKTLSFLWEAKETKSILVSSLHVYERLIIESIPLYCVNTRTHTVSEIESEYSLEEIDFLLSAPSVPTEKLTELSQRVLERFPDMHFPLPTHINIETLTPTPTPSLVLSGYSEYDKKSHIMTLDFDYGKTKVQAYDSNKNILLTEEDKTFKIVRDLAFEKTCTQALENLGFIWEKTKKGYLSYANPSMQVAIERWRDFIENHIPLLEAQGWEINKDELFSYRFEYAEEISVQSTEASEINPWFELSFNVEIGGNSVPLLPIVISLLEEFEDINDLPPKLNLAMGEGRYLHIDAKEIKPILKMIFELYDHEGETLKVEPYNAHLLDIDENSSFEWKGAKKLRDLSLKLRKFEGIEHIPASANLNAQLREYQEFGLDWLNFLHTFGFSGILADDMGLGKTVQTLAFLQILKERGELHKPSLIIMPTSLLGNWKNEIKKFTPNLSYVELYGKDRADDFARVNDFDIILTTYQLAQRDEEKYQKLHFEYIILDEAQKIKNPKTKMAVAIKSFKSNYKLALSGTPIENHLGELWSIFDFLMSGFLDNLSFFRSYYQKPIEEEHDFKRRALLNQKVAPFILRRTKDEVVLELPAKTEIIKKAIFSKKQATLYENIRITMESKVREAIQGKGLSRSHITILDALLKLRQVCCHPQILKLESAQKVKESAKLEMFLELVDELIDEGRKILVFSQFTTMLSILEKEIIQRKIRYTKLTGSTRKREEAIEKFTKGDAQIFFISLKAGGVGLNLVEADTVIHYDPWWNPAVENQATDRAYRIGQDKAVFVYKLIVENSIEEQILKLQEKKKSLQEGIYKGQDNDKKETKFTGDELVALLRM